MDWMNKYQSVAKNNKEWTQPWLIDCFHVRVFVCLQICNGVDHVMQSTQVKAAAFKINQHDMNNHQPLP